MYISVLVFLVLFFRLHLVLACFTAAPSCGSSMNRYGLNGLVVGIIGGQESIPNEYPSIVYINLLTPNRPFRCGGTIISENYILSAAHCFNNDGIKRITVTFANHNVRQGDEGEFSMEIKKERIRFHENYNRKTDDYDFALLKLPFPLNFTASRKVQKVCLPTDCNDGTCQEGSTAYIAGWGDLVEGSQEGSDILQHITTKIARTETCKAQYLEGKLITDNMICAESDGGRIDACQGDSGGPLYTKVNGRYHLCGVTSWGYGCANPHLFGVYSKVCAVMDWIRKHSDVT